MMSKQNPPIRKVLIGIGACLVLASVLLFFGWQVNIHIAEQKAVEYVRVIREQIPTPQGAVPEERRDNAMATLSIDQTDFVGVLELPQYGSVLPIGADWGNPAKHPCRLSGSIYDRTMQIGATSQQGQYGFYRDISVGDRLFFTDMEGNRYAYAVTDIRYENNADQSTLHRTESALTLFIKNIYAFEYIILSCDVVS